MRSASASWSRPTRHHGEGRAHADMRLARADFKTRRHGSTDRQALGLALDRVQQVMKELKRKEKVDGRNEVLSPTLMGNNRDGGTEVRPLTRLLSSEPSSARRRSGRGVDPARSERWWAPKSFSISLLSCETDARVGGRYLWCSVPGARPWSSLSVPRSEGALCAGRAAKGTADRWVDHGDFRGTGGGRWIVHKSAALRRKLSTVRSVPGRRPGCPRRSSNWTSFFEYWARAEGRAAPSSPPPSTARSTSSTSSSNAIR